MSVDFIDEPTPDDAMKAIAAAREKHKKPKIFGPMVSLSSFEVKLIILVAFFLLAVFSIIILSLSRGL